MNTTQTNGVHGGARAALKCEQCGAVYVIGEDGRPHYMCRCHDAAAPKAQVEPSEFSDLAGAHASIGRERDWFAEGAIEGAPLVVLASGEKVGKSWILIDLAVSTVLGTKWLGAFAIKRPGEAWYVDCEYDAIGALQGSPYASCIVATTADSVTITRPDGKIVSIEALPATRGGSSLRGRTLVGALLDEVAFFRDADFVINDEAIVQAVAPRVVGDGQIIACSTPWARMGLLFDLWSSDFGKPRTALVAHATTPLMRNNDPALMAMISREMARNPSNARREYFAEFTDSEAALLSGADVDAAIDATRERPFRRTCRYAITCDIGLRNDSTALLVFHTENRKRDNGPPESVLIVDAVRRLTPTLDQRVTIDQVEHAIANLADEYDVTTIAGDLHYADAIAPRLKQRGIRFAELSMSAQERRATSMQARFTSQSVRLIDDRALVSELKNLRIVRRAGGGFSVGAPDSKRKHDDLADCLLLAHEVTLTLPSYGGDIVCSSSVGIGEGGLSVSHLWRERREREDGSPYWVPSGPPVGSVEWTTLRREQRAQGLTVLDEPDPFDFDGSINVPIGH